MNAPALEYDHIGNPHGVMPPMQGGKRDGYASKSTPDPRPKQYLSTGPELKYEVTAMFFTSETRQAVRMWWIGGRAKRRFWDQTEFDRWVVLDGDKVTSYADEEFRELFKPAILCGYEGE